MFVFIWQEPPKNLVFVVLLLSLISCSIKGQEVLIKTHKKCFVICTVITQSSLLDHTRCKSLKIQQHYFDSMIDSLGLQHRWRSDSPAAQNTTDLQNLEALNSWWGKRISKNHSKRSSIPNLQFTFLVRDQRQLLGCTKCQKVRKWRFFTVRARGIGIDVKTDLGPRPRGEILLYYSKGEKV